MSTHPSDVSLSVPRVDDLKPLHRRLYPRTAVRLVCSASVCFLRIPSLLKQFPPMRRSPAIASRVTTAKGNVDASASESLASASILDVRSWGKEKNPGDVSSPELPNVSRTATAGPPKAQSAVHHDRAAAQEGQGKLPQPEVERFTRPEPRSACRVGAGPCARITMSVRTYFVRPHAPSRAGGG